MSLLYREKMNDYPLADANLLRGRTVPESAVQEILERGKLLTPETCGWHYVEGLRLDDDYRLALFWDKIGLDHNGGRLAQEGHTVLFVSGERKFIPETEWEKFLEDQAQAARGEENRDPSRCQGADRQPRSPCAGASCGRLHLWLDVEFERGDRDYQETGIGRSRTAHYPRRGNQECQSRGRKGLAMLQQGPNLIVVQPDSPRVRFVLQGREIVYDKSGFHIEATAGEAKKDQAVK